MLVPTHDPTMSYEEALRVLANTFAPQIEQANRPIRDIVDWAEEHFYVPETKLPIVFEPHQRIILRLMFDDSFASQFGIDGGFQELIFSTTKKSGKTTCAAVVGRWIAEEFGNQNEIYSLANDKEQARGRIYDKILKSLENDPNWDRKAGILRDNTGKPVWRVIEREMRNLVTQSVIKAVSVDYKGEAGSNPTATLWCVAGETDVLTERGWIRADELQLDDALATLDINGIVSYEVPRAINKTIYSGDMIRFDSRRASFLVTPNHRVYGKFWTHSRYKVYSEWSFEEAADLHDGKYAAGYLRGDSNGFASTRTDECDEDLARFFGYYISEGNVRNYTYKDRNVPTYIHISQSPVVNPNTYARIGAAMLAVGLDAKPHVNGWEARHPNFANYLKTIYGYSGDKFVPDVVKRASAQVQRVFLMAYLEGDGWKTNTAYQCCTVSKRLADDLMQVALHVGLHPRLMSVKPGRTNNSQTMYRLSFSLGNIAWQRSGFNHWTKEHYEGTVVCPSLTNGTFFIRHNGKCVWTGNSELWGYKSEEAKRFWDELTPVPTRAKSIRMVETYAGYSDESSLLMDIYLRGKKGIRLTKEHVPDWPFPDEHELPIWIHPDAAMFMYWDEGEKARRMPWQTPAYYRKQAASGLRPEAFRRLHLNEWTTSKQAFIPIEWWDACSKPAIPSLNKHQLIVIAADGSVSGDCTGLIGVSRYTDNNRCVLCEQPLTAKHHVTPENYPDGHEYKSRSTQLVVEFEYMWTPPDGGKLDYSQTIDPTLRRLLRDYNVAECAYDEFQLHKLMTDIRNDGLGWCKVFSQSNNRLIADKQLYDMIKTRDIHHRGNLPNLREHLENAAAKIPVGEETKLRIIKKSERQHIDLAVCLSMAAYEALRLNIE